jgi:integrase/recombinase XerD
MESENGLIVSFEANVPALRNAVSLWADATTDSASERRLNLLHDKSQAVLAFFEQLGKRPGAVNPIDVKAWQSTMEAAGLARSTIYTRICFLSSFFRWAMRDPQLGQFITTNPALLARPKAPKSYQTESTKSLTDEQLKALVGEMRKRATSTDLTAKRDYALLLFYVLTGMRRNEVLQLRGKDVEFKDDRLIIRSRVKGGDYTGREVRDPLLRSALESYLVASGRDNVICSDRPLWTRHDKAGRPGAPLTSHAFVGNLKRYAKDAGIEHIHLHQTRHTYARLIAEQTGSIIETQDALGHKNAATTRVYVQRISIKRDKHSENIARLLDPAGDENGTATR